MAPLVSHVRAFLRTEHFRRLWKYASVSVVSTLVTQVVLFLTYHVWNVGPAMECNVIATVVASVPAYYLNRTWTWGKRGRSNVWGEVVPFWTISLAAMVLSTGAVGLAAHLADRMSDSLERALIVNCANLFTYAVLWTARYFIFNRFLFGTPVVGVTGTAPSEPGDDPSDAPAVATGHMADPEPGLSGLAATDTADPAL
ncbi:MAG: GtrA family protein [Acidimicrobiales bacterium]|jgi:putative flippase GtrA